MVARADTVKQADRRQPLTRSIEKAVAVLDFLATADSPVGLSEISRSLGLPKTTAHRLLSTLIPGGMVEFDPATQAYSLGTKLIQYGLAAVARITVHRAARPALERLQEATGETAVLAVRRGALHIYLDQVESNQSIHQRMDLGRALALTDGAAGLAMLASLSEPELNDQLTGLDDDALRTVLVQVRHSGYAVTHDEHGTLLAAPIFDRTGQVVGAVMLCGPRFRFRAQKLPRLAKAVRVAADAVSTELGHVRAAASVQSRPWTG